jgi:chromosome segregation ATPase
MNNYIINPSLKESAENQIKKLQDFLLPSSDDPTNNKLILIEKEFSRLQNSESPNEITFSNYMKVMKQFKVPLTSNELMEIFNNFPRIKGDRIRMNDFINALNSKSPSTFFLQSDPSYLNELEARLIKGQNRIKELEKFILVNNNENEEFKTQLKKSMEENKLLKNKINELNSQILQYFLFREEKNMANPDVIQMKEKMRTMEIKNKTMDSELNDKFVKYEKRIEEMQKTYEDQRVNLLKEKDGFKEQINQLKNEKEKVKNEFDKKEIIFKREIEKLNEKLQKYKKNYSILSNKNEMNKKEKEKILNSFKDKGLEPEQIIAFVNNSSDIQEILNKIKELENKNLNREETYKKICMEVNKSQVNMELEKLKKKHDEEKRGLLLIIAQKNNELNSIKSEFFAIMNELEKLKANNKFK